MCPRRRHPVNSFPQFAARRKVKSIRHPVSARTARSPGLTSIHPPGPSPKAPKESRAAPSPLPLKPSRRERIRETVFPGLLRLGRSDRKEKKKRVQRVFRSIKIPSAPPASLRSFPPPLGFASFNYRERYTRRPQSPRPPSINPFVLAPLLPPPAPKVALTVFYIVLLLYYICINHTGLGLLLSRHDTMLLLPLLLLLLLLLPLKTPIVRHTATPVKSPPKSLSKKRMVSPRESRRLTWRAKIFFFFFVRAKSNPTRVFSLLIFFSLPLFVPFFFWYHDVFVIQCMIS